MLVDTFPKLKNNPLLRLVNKYFSSVVHMAVVAVLALLSALCAWEVPVFYCYMAFAVLIAFLCDDATGFLPLATCGYMSISYEYRNYTFPATAAFDDPQNVLQLGFCVGVIVLLLVVRAIYSLAFYHKQGTPRLWLGLCALALSYLLGGAFSGYYGANSVLFGILNAAVLCVLYFTLRYTINWKERKTDYLFCLMCVMGVLLLVQIASIYVREGAFVDGKMIDRHHLCLGWGHYNSVGCVLSMCACAPLYFAATKKHGWLFTALGVLFMLGVVFTMSRGSIFFGGVAFLVALVISLVKANKRERILSLIVVGVCAAAALVVGLCFLDKVKEMFDSMLQHGASDNGRLRLFKEAWAYFLSSPVFGAGWFGANETSNPFGYFMAHNTYFQILGSLGVVGACAYLIHRVQTCVLLFRHRSLEKAMIATSMFAMILICFMDCHFFQCGPSALLYSALLAFMEGSDIRAGADTRLRLKRKNREPKTGTE